MKIREKIFLRFRKKDTYNKEEDTSNVNEIREKIKDVILDKIDLFEYCLKGQPDHRLLQ